MKSRLNPRNTLLSQHNKNQIVARMDARLRLPLYNRLRSPQLANRPRSLEADRGWMLVAADRSPSPPIAAAKRHQSREMGARPCNKLGEMKSFFASCRRAETRLNKSVAESRIRRYFKLEARKSSFTAELRAGTTTFLTMAYIISVNAAIISDSGGPCTVDDCASPGPECRIQPDPGYARCLSTARSDLVVATVLTAMVGSFAMGAVANLPFAIAPGMGTNAYFTYNMVGFHGSGPVPYGTALAAMTLEGLLFVSLSVLGLRGKLARLIPRPIRLASAAGMGLFLAFTGLQAHQGLGLVGPSKSTLVTLAACASTDPVTGACTGGLMRSPTFWLGVVGFLITTFCLAKEIKGGMIYGIVFVTVVSWFRGTSVTYFPDTQIGNSSYAYFRRVVDFHMIRRTAGAVRFRGFNTSEVWLAVATLLYVDILDSTGTMYSVAELAGLMDGQNGDRGGFEGEYRAFIVDASTTIVSASLGTTTATAYLESTAGIKEGGRTGITAITVGFYFLLALFFTPLFASVPPYAVGPALVVVGAMMMVMVKEIEWARMKEAVPAFVTLVLMPLTFSIANGIIAGLGIYMCLRLYDFAEGLARRGRKMGEMMADARNQVAAAAATPEVTSTAAASV